MYTRSLNYKIFRVLDFLILFMMVFSAPLQTLAAVWTDQADYTPGSTVWIHGDNSDADNEHNWVPGEVVHVDVTGPNRYSAACEAVVDGSGAWACTVTLWESELAVGEYTYTATGHLSGNVETGTFTDAVVGHPSVNPLPAPPPSTIIVFNPDSGGQNDIDPSSLNNQSDLSAYGINGTGAAGKTTQYGWKWDQPTLSGNNSQDVCVYLSSTTSGTSDPNAAEYAVCYSIVTDAAGNISSEFWDAWYCPTYNTANASNGGQKCFGNSTQTLPTGVDIQAAFTFTQNVLQQFLTDPDLDSQVILDVYSNLELDLINICSKKSSSPASDSADCGLERAPAFLKLVKVVQDGTAVPADWTLYWDGPSSNDGSVLGNNTQFVPVPDGTYGLSESTVANYEQVSLVCSPIAASGNSVTLNQGVEETCAFTNKLSIVAPMPRVIKGNAEGNDTVATLNEPGGSVTINVVVYNDAAASIGDATLTSLTDDVYGDITNVHDSITATTCATGGVIPGGGSYSCSFTVSIASEPATINDTVTATLQNNHSSVSDTDQANVVVNNVMPTINVDKSANPTTLPEPGGDVEFTVVVTNNSFEPVTLTSLSDNVYGDLNGQGTCATGGTIAAGGNYTCKFTGAVSSEPGFYTDTVEAVATDNDGTTDTETDDATVVLTDVAPIIRITKTASPTHVDETGGNVTFTFLVENIGAEDVTLTTLSDTVFGDLDGKGTCDVPQTILIGGSYSCTYTVFLASDSLTAHYNVVTATAVDDDGTPATDDDNETVTFDDVAPVIRITKTASPTHVDETGGNVTFTFLVENIGVEDVTLTTLSDTVFGDLDGKGTCDVPQTILIGDSYNCSITTHLASDSLTDHINVVTASAVDDDNTPASDTDDETVTFDDVAPVIRITKTANPIHVPETGGDVTFTFLVENIGAEDVTLTTLSDTVFGDLDGKGTCDVPQTILIGGSYSCTYTVFLASDSLTAHYNVVTATAVDDDGTPATDDDNETVTFDDVLPTVDLTKSAVPSTLAEPGGNFVFTLSIHNTSPEAVTISALTDDNTLSAECLALVGTSIPAGGTVSCTYMVNHTEAGSYPNTASVTVQDNEGNPANASDDETVTVTDVLPTITVEKTALPTSVPETGMDVLFTFKVTNTSVEPVTIASLSDTDFILTGDSDCQVNTVLPVGGYCESSQTEFIKGDYESGISHSNTFTATAKDNEGNVATAIDDATVTFTDVEPQIDVEKYVSVNGGATWFDADTATGPDALLGSSILFKFVVTNTGDYALSSLSLSDNVYNLSGCTIPSSLAVGDSFDCQISATAAAAQHTNTVTSSGSFTDGAGATESDSDTDDANYFGYGLTELLKLTSISNSTPAVDPSMTWTFSIYAGPHYTDAAGSGAAWLGSALATSNTSGDTDGILEFGDFQLDPTKTYSICELSVPSGYSVEWKVDTDGDGIPDQIVLPYNPNSKETIPQDIGNKCFDFGAGTSYPIPANGLLAWQVINSFPGGEPRTPGYWKNWNRCTGGGQAANADRNGGRDKGFTLLEDILTTPGITWDDILSDSFVVPITTCQQAVEILDQRVVTENNKVGDGKKLASDAARTLAMHLLAAQLNDGNGACIIQDVKDVMLAAEKLLDSINFDGKKTTAYLTSKSPNYAYALSLAKYLDAYNNSACDFTKLPPKPSIKTLK